MKFPYVGLRHPPIPWAYWAMAANDGDLLFALNKIENPANLFGLRGETADRRFLQ